MQIERIVIGTDFGAPSIAGARWATDVLAPDADVILAHMIALPAAPGAELGVEMDAAELERAARDAAGVRLAAVASLLPGERVRTALYVDRPHAALAELAEQTGADLVVIGPHGDRPRPWRRLGTTADRLVRIARTPVLVSIGEPSLPPRRLLVPIEDVGDPAVLTAVLRWARHLAGRFGAAVTLLSVVTATSYEEAAARILAHAGGGAAPDPGSRDTVRAATTQWLAEVAAAELPDAQVSTEVIFGDPGEAIVEAGTRERADLILLGRRSARTVMPEALGSTVATVLQGAACPVLVVIEPADASSDEW